MFRAYLGQPLILYGHHTDLADGLDALETTAAMINALPDVAWAPLHAIAAATHRSRRDGPAMTVRMHSLAADLRVPEGVETLTVELPAVVGDGRRLEVRCAPGGTEPITLHESEPSDITFALPPGHIGQLHVRIASSAEPQVRGRRVRPVWPAWRRALTECRDRSAPARSRFSGLAR